MNRRQCLTAAAAGAAAGLVAGSPWASCGDPHRSRSEPSFWTASRPRPRSVLAPAEELFPGRGASARPAVPDLGHGGKRAAPDVDRAPPLVLDRLLGCDAYPAPGMSSLQLQRQLGITRYETAWALLQKLHRAMVRPDRDPLQAEVEVDESYIGGPEVGLRGGRQLLDKALVVGRCRGPRPCVWTGFGSRSSRTPRAAR
jgi:hypothetical protein